MCETIVHSYEICLGSPRGPHLRISLIYDQVNILHLRELGHATQNEGPLAQVLRVQPI